jgi:hypothetical protein
MLIKIYGMFIQGYKPGNQDRIEMDFKQQGKGELISLSLNLNLKCLNLNNCLNELM